MARERQDELAHASGRVGPRHRESALDVGPDLRAQPQQEAAAGHGLEVHAVDARVMGLRAKATTIEVPSSSGAATVAARASGRKGSWRTSDDHTPS